MCFTEVVMGKISFSNGDIGAICSQLEYLMHAGIGSSDAVNLIAEEETRPACKRVFQDMAAHADEGADLNEVFEKSGAFPEYVSRMISVGEKTGRTEEALSALSASCENRASLDRHIRSALLYPAVLMVVMVAVVAVLLIYVLPVFNDVYVQLGSGLTGVAGVLLNIGKLLGKISPLLIAVFCAIAVFLILFASVSSFREKVLSKWWSMRGDKGVAGKISCARFAQALSMAMSSGFVAEEAVSAASEVLGDDAVSKAKSEKCLDLLNNGYDLAEALRDSELLPGAECRMLSAGNKSGSGDQAMDKIARRMTEESDAALEDSVSKVEPIMVAITSLLVGFVLLSVMLPLTNIMSAIG